MLLTSFVFLLFFLVVFLLHYGLFCKNRNAQNAFIFIVSCVFYSWWDWRFLLLLLITSLSTYSAGIWMEKYEEQLSLRKWVHVTCIMLNIGILLGFKYFNFFVETFVDLFKTFGLNLSIHPLHIILPVGISFYTFSALSYSIDVYQKKVKPTHDLLAYLSYVTFFPAILSGPINRAGKQLPQFFQCRYFDYSNVVEGSKSLVWGIFVKLCVADRLGIYVDTVYANMIQHTGITLLFTSVVYSLQIYADFAGYSWMAFGLGKMLGIDLQTNFIRPYFAGTVTDFWRRWHISLTTWFRDYIYFPLGGNRCSRQRWMINTMIVFVVSGLWHGAAYTFLLWGALHGICMILEKVIYGDRLKTMCPQFSVVHLLRMGSTFAIINVLWILFRIDSVRSFQYIGSQLYDSLMGGVILCL